MGLTSKAKQRNLLLMTQPTTTSATYATVADFTPTDPMLFHQGKKKWLRFVAIDPRWIAIFGGKGGTSAQTWEYIVTVDKETVRFIWDTAVADGSVRFS
jgi:hypothetical protein